MRAEEAAAFLQCENLKVMRGGRLVVDLPMLAVNRGSALAVLGPNGAGKSTLLMSLAGLLDLASGRISLGGELHHEGRAPAPSSSRRLLGVVFQEPWLPGSTVLSAVGFGLRLRSVPRQERSKQAARMLEGVGISHLADRSPKELSGGERRLVALAMALVVRPQLLLLDEPLSGVDEEHRQHVESVVLRSYLAEGGTVVISTHDPELPLRNGYESMTL